MDGWMDRSIYGWIYDRWVYKSIDGWIDSSIYQIVDYH